MKAKGAETHWNGGGGHRGTRSIKKSSSRRLGEGDYEKGKENGIFSPIGSQVKKRGGEGRVKKRETEPISSMGVKTRISEGKK